MRYGPTGLERNQNEILSGEAPELIAGQLSDLITGRDPRGGNVELNIVPAVQQAAYTAMTEKDYVGAVVAIEPSTGKVLAMVSTPSYDPNPLASHSDAVQRQAYNDLVNADPSPLLNRADRGRLPAGLDVQAGHRRRGAAAGLHPADPGDRRSRRSPCRTPAAPPCPTSPARPARNGGGADVPLIDALAFSCNTAFAEVAMSLGAVPVRKQAEALGVDGQAAGHRAGRGRIAARRHPGHRRARADRDRSAGRRGHPVPDGLDHRDHRQPRREAVEWLATARSSSKRLFVGSHLEPHAPYGDPRSQRPVADRYDDEVAESDAQLARLVAALKPEAASSIIVIDIEDHGEAFGEHCESYAQPIRLRHDAACAAPSSPGPGVSTARTTMRPISLVDVAPTVSAAARYCLDSMPTGSTCSSADQLGGALPTSRSLR